MTDIAPIPAAWLAVMPRSGPRVEPAEVEREIIPDHEARERVRAVAKGKRGDEWAAIRRAVDGVRMFRIATTPPGVGLDLPEIAGVDSFLSQRVIYAMARDPELRPLAPETIASVFASSLSILRADAGPSSKWTAEHFARKWERATPKAEGEAQGAERMLAAITAGVNAAIEREDATGRPAIVQWDDRFFVLDDREGRATYEGPIKAVGLRPLARKIWGADTTRILDVPQKNGMRPATPAELVDLYGTIVTQLRHEFSGVPRVDDLTMVLVPRLTPPEPLEDPEVAEWLAILDPSGEAERWVWTCRIDRCMRAVPAIALVGGAHAGKSLFAAGVARAAGQTHANKLGAVLGRFRSQLTTGPVLFGDEGMPRDPSTGVPLTEEFREIVTASDHPIERKGTDAAWIVRGCMRVIMAANRLDRLFSARGVYSGHDVDAITRRLLVIDLDDARARRARDAAQALGAFENDPVRLERVAGHFRWIMERGDLTAPGARASVVARELRAGSDMAAQALGALETCPGGWMAVDKTRGVVHVEIGTWATVTRAPSSQALARAIAPYVTVPSTLHRLHPTTGARLDVRTRWIGLDLERLIADGFQIETEAP